VALSGTGATGGVVSLSPASLTFQHNVNLSCPPKAVTVTNTGTGALSISSIAMTGPFTETNTCGTSLAAGASCQISVTFVPTAVGTVSGALSLTDSAAGSQQTVDLTGTGLPPCVLRTNAASAAVVRGLSDATQFTISDPAPSCHTSNLSMACAANGPASCQFAPQVIPPGGTSQLTVGNLRALAADRLNFQATGTSGPQDTTAVNLTVLLEDFSFTNYPSSSAVSAGQGTSYALTLVPVNGLTGSVQLSCAGAPAGATCTVSPGTITLAGTLPAQAKVTVTTTARSLAGPGGGWPGPKPDLPLRWLGLLALLALLLAAVAAAPDLVGGDRRTRRARLTGLLLAGMLLMLLAWAACGGGGMSSSVASGTPAGSYSLTITGTYVQASGQTSALNHTTTLTLQVQ